MLLHFQDRHGDELAYRFADGDDPDHPNVRKLIHGAATREAKQMVDAERELVSLWLLRNPSATETEIGQMISSSTEELAAWLADCGDIRAVTGDDIYEKDWYQVWPAVEDRVDVQVGFFG